MSRLRACNLCDMRHVTQGVYGGLEREAHTHRSGALSVYYPFALVDLLEYREADEHKQTGEVLLSFLDQDGCKVTLRARRDVIEALAARLATPPARS